MWRILRDNPFHAIGMTAIDPGIGVALVQITCLIEEVIEALTPSRGCQGRSGSHIPTAGIFNVKDSNLGVTGACHQSSVVGMWHELDREDVGPVAREDAGV